VLAAYGSADLDPQIGHKPMKIGTRWTVSREARFELLDRPLEENRCRHAADAAVKRKRRCIELIGVVI